MYIMQTPTVQFGFRKFLMNEKNHYEYILVASAQLK